MGDWEVKLSQQQAVGAAMDQWITGIPGRIPDHAIFVENPEHAPYAKELAGEQSIVFVLDGGNGADEDTVVPVSGFFDVVGEELLVAGSLSLEVQDYLAIPFISLMGVTVVRITTSEDWQAFFDDAEEARRSGHFVWQLTEVNAVFAERGLLDGGQSVGSPLARLHIASDGTVLSGPYGSTVGKAGDSLADIRTRCLALEPESALASVCDAEAVRDSLGARPWIPRYLAALDAWKFIPRDDRSKATIVGFGASVYGASPTDDLPSPRAPFIIHSDGQYTLLDTASGRTFRVGPDAAAIIEALSNLRHLQLAASAVAAALGVSVAAAEESTRAVLEQFERAGVDVFGAG